MSSAGQNSADPIELDDSSIIEVAPNATPTESAPAPFEPVRPGGKLVAEVVLSSSDDDNDDTDDDDGDVYTTSVQTPVKTPSASTTSSVKTPLLRPSKPFVFAGAKAPAKPATSATPASSASNSQRFSSTPKVLQTTESQSPVTPLTPVLAPSSQAPPPPSALSASTAFEVEDELHQTDNTIVDETEVEAELTPAQEAEEEKSKVSNAHVEKEASDNDSSTKEEAEEDSAISVSIADTEASAGTPSPTAHDDAVTVTPTEGTDPHKALDEADSKEQNAPGKTTHDKPEQNAPGKTTHDKPDLDESLAKRRHINNLDDLGLPNTVTRLQTNEHGDVLYLIGTSHFSKESQEDVVKTIRAVQPHLCLLELCRARSSLLYLDEERLLSDSEGALSVENVVAGMRQGNLIMSLLQAMSASLTKQLGMAPGGEFRVALREAEQVKDGCSVALIDRPIQVTMKRAFASLSLWQKMKFIYHVLTGMSNTITPEEVEKMKDHDMIEMLMEEIKGHFPEFTNVLVHERDLYMAYALGTALHHARHKSKPHLPPAQDSSRPPEDENEPIVAVGVVGLGHVPGIVKHWEKLSEEQIKTTLVIPKPSTTERVVLTTLKVGGYCALLYSGYRLVARPTFNVAAPLLRDVVEKAVVRLQG